MQKAQNIYLAIKKTTLHKIQGDKNTVILITGKGTDPYIMRKNGQKEKWSDAEVAKEELKMLVKGGKL